MADTQVVESIQKESPQIEAMRIGLMRSARRLANTPVNIPAYKVAGLSPYETQAMDLAQQGLGVYKPYMQTGLAAMGGASNAFAQISPIASRMAGMATGIPGGVSGYQNAFNNIAGASTDIGSQYANQMTNAANSAVTQADDYSNDMTRMGAQGYNQMANYGNQMAGYGMAGADALNPYINNMANVGGQVSNQVNPLAGASVDVGMGALGEGAMYGGNMQAIGNASMQNVPGMYNTGITQQFMNPYQQEVTDNTIREIRRQGAIGMNDVRARSVAAGAYGGSRSAIAEQEYQRNIDDTMARTIAQDRSTNYQQAQQAGMAAFEADRARQLQAYQQGLAANQAAAGITQSGRNLALAGLNQGINSALQTGQLNLAGQQAAAGTSAQGTQLGLEGLQAGANANLAGLQYNMGATQNAAGLMMDANNMAIGAAQGAGNLGLAGQGQALAANQAGAGTYLDAQRTALGGLQSSGQLYGSLGEAYGNLGQQYANMGALETQLGQEQSRYLAMLGGVQREQAQQVLDARRQTLMARAYEPYQRLGFVSDIYSRTPTSQSTVQMSSAPAASPLSSAIGTGIQAYAAYNGFNNLWGNR